MPRPHCARCRMPSHCSATQVLMLGPSKHALTRLYKADCKPRRAKRPKGALRQTRRNFEPRPRAYVVCIYGRCISIPRHVYIPRCGRSLNPSQPGAIAEVENARPKTPAQNLLRRPPDATGKVRCESFSTVNLFRFSGKSFLGPRAASCARHLKKQNFR